MIDAATRQPSCWRSTPPGMTGHSLVPMSARAPPASATKPVQVQLLSLAALTIRLEEKPVRHDRAMPAAGRAPDELLARCSLVLGCAWLRWAAGGCCANPVFAMGAIVVTGDVTHNTRGDILRANVAPGCPAVLHARSGPGPARSSPAPGSAGRGAARVSGTGCGWCCRSTRPVAYHWGEGDRGWINSHGEVFEANIGRSGSTSCRVAMGPDAATAPQVLAMYRTAGAGPVRRAGPGGGTSWN